jgi:hypothetical protein
VASYVGEIVEGIVEPIAAESVALLAGVSG